MVIVTHNTSREASAVAESPATNQRVSLRSLGHSSLGPLGDPHGSKKTRGTTVSNQTLASGSRAVVVDSLSTDVFKNLETVFWDSPEEELKAVQVAVAPGNSSNPVENVVVDIIFTNKVLEEAELYFSITPGSYRADLVQSHLLTGPVRVPAAKSDTVFSQVSLGRLARRLGVFAFYWGAVVIPVNNANAPASPSASAPAAPAV